MIAKIAQCESDFKDSEKLIKCVLKGCFLAEEYSTSALADGRTLLHKLLINGQHCTLQMLKNKHNMFLWKIMQRNSYIFI